LPEGQQKNREVTTMKNQSGGKASKPEDKPPGERRTTKPGIDHLGDLPQTHGSDTVFLVARDPHWLFTYWDIEISKHPGGPAYLRVMREDGSLESEIEVPFETRNWHIPVSGAGTGYMVEIGYRRHDAWHAIARSGIARTPAEGVSDSGEFQYATVPLHLSFQALMDTVGHTLKDGDALVRALARLQRDGHLFPGGLDGDPDQKTVLEALLGKDFMESLGSQGLGSGEFSDRVRAALEEKLGSGAVGGFSSGGGMSSPQGGASLWGAFEALFSAGGPTSWAAALSSWQEAAQAAPGAPASWMQAVRSSWEQAPFSSWNEQAFASWAKGAESSWAGGASENLSSPGIGREFFMHVNAEVIFYGGTDPQAKVTIDGHPVTLGPNGTFRYHFIFPDGACEIPIVATSPDGVETRRATLRFERATEKSGKVDDTPQPPIGAPMGARG
jgi:uncharacterized protein